MKFLLTNLQIYSQPSTFIGVRGIGLPQKWKNWIALDPPTQHILT